MSDTSDDLARMRTYVQDLAGQGASRLPPEPKLAKILDVSRGRLRTLLKKLEAEGMIWRHVGKGTFLGPRPVASASSDLSNEISLGDIMDARQLFEPPLAAEAAVHATRADIVALERCLSEMSQAKSYVEWKRLDDRLHRLIAEATHNRLLLALLDTLRRHGSANLDPRIEQALGRSPAPTETTRQHIDIVTAIKSGDPAKAEAEMRTHLQSVRALLFGLR